MELALWSSQVRSGLPTAHPLRLALLGTALRLRLKAGCAAPDVGGRAVPLSPATAAPASGRCGASAVRPREAARGARGCLLRSAQSRSRRVSGVTLGLRLKFVSLLGCVKQCFPANSEDLGHYFHRYFFYPFLSSLPPDSRDSGVCVLCLRCFLSVPPTPPSLDLPSGSLVFFSAGSSMSFTPSQKKNEFFISLTVFLSAGVSVWLFCQ